MIHQKPNFAGEVKNEDHIIPKNRREGVRIVLEFLDLLFSDPEYHFYKKRS